MLRTYRSVHQNKRRGESFRNKGRSGTGGNHRKTKERLKGPRAQAAGAAWPQGLKPATKSLLQGAALERSSASNAKKQQSNKPPRGQTGPSCKATPKGPSAYGKQNASVNSEVKVRPAAQQLASSQQSALAFPACQAQLQPPERKKELRPKVWVKERPFLGMGNPQKRVARRNALPTLVLERIPVKHS